MEDLIKKCQRRIKKSLIDGFEYNHLVIARSNKFLREHESERLPMFVLYVDLVGSTKMSSELDPKIFNIVIRTFSQEMSYVIEQYDGYVLKFVGDAVLGYFLADKSPHQIANKIVDCAKTMQKVIEKGINPVLEEENYPELFVKITIDFGNCSIVRYGSDNLRSHIDIIGLTLNLAAKMQQITEPGHITIGEYVYCKLSAKFKMLFKKVKTEPNSWKYHELKRKNAYTIYVNPF